MNHSLDSHPYNYSYIQDGVEALPLLSQALQMPSQTLLGTCVEEDGRRLALWRQQPPITAEQLE